MSDEKEPVELSSSTIQHFEERMEVAVTNAIKKAMTPETAEMFWSAGITMLQRNTAQHAGRLVIGGLMGLIKKVSIFLLIGGLVYSVGGWSALAGLFKHLFTTGGTP